MLTRSVKMTTTGTSFKSHLKELTIEVRKACMTLSAWHRIDVESCISHNENTLIMTLTFMSHRDCVLFGAVIVDNDSRCIESAALRIFSLKVHFPLCIMATQCVVFGGTMNRVGEQQPCKSTAKKEKKKQGLNSCLLLHFVHYTCSNTSDICSSCFELPFPKSFAAK